MPDSRPSDLLLFVPVPLERVHARGWTAAAQRAFIAALARHGTVRAAAHNVGRSPTSAYALRRRPGAEGFAAAWDAALDCSVLDARTELIAGAFAPERVPVIRRGKVIGTRERFNVRVALAAMQAAERRKVVREPVTQYYCRKCGQSVNADLEGEPPGAIW